MISASGRPSPSGRATTAVRQLEQAQHCAGEHGAGRLRQKSSREQIGGPNILGEDDELRPDHCGKHAAGQHPGHRLGAKLHARGVGRRKPIGLVRRRVEAGAEGAEKQQRERSPQHGCGRDDAGERAASRSDLQSRAAAVGFGQHADRERPDPHADRHQGDGKRRQRRIGRQYRAGDAAGRHDHRGVAAGKRLRRGKHQRVAGCKPVVGDLGARFGDDRHGGMFRLRKPFSGRTGAVPGRVL